MGTVVVGYVPKPEGDAALSAGINEARLRGSRLDVFGYTAERRGERALIDEYQRTVTALFDKLDAGNVDLAADIASIPEHIRGYGHVKEAHLHKAKAREADLLKEWDNPLRVVQQAA